MKISVTEKNITTACERDSHHCMVADAIRDQIKNAQYILVDVQSIRWSDPDKGIRYTYLTPPVVQQQIIKFDQGKALKPFGFALNAPVTVRPMIHVKDHDPVVIKRARAKYEKKRKASRQSGRQMVRANIPSREREFGVRVLNG